MENKQAIAKSRYLRIGQRKMLGTCSLVRGKDVAVAKAILIRTQKKAAKFISKTLDSAIANAKNKNMDAKYLFIKSIRADMGPSTMRHIPWSRGTALPIKKRTVHLSIILEEKAHEKKKEAKPVSTEKVVENKEVKTEEKTVKPVKKEKAIKTGKVKTKVKTAK
ncbi:MAG TPA: 50S ribosomal protein L22 [Patescibacteria group bacterium]|nr:50S ribosomal protein L22 [Patescibacteria group bacterium]